MAAAASIGAAMVLLWAVLAVLTVGAEAGPSGRKLLELVPEQPLVLEYHGGKVLGASGVINVYILWYGGFSKVQRGIVNGFFRSIQKSSGARTPSVHSWWKLAGGYKDSAGTVVPAAVAVAGQYSNAGSLGKNLKRADLPRLVLQAVAGGKLKQDASGLYLVLTAADVLVERFCMDSCGTHNVLSVGDGPHKLLLPWAWVGNSATQCPGTCAWPFAPLSFPGAPPGAPAKSPNNDVGLDGMIINISSMLAGASTNPFGDAFYQGDALAPLEAATACTGIYGAHSYPGYPGDLLTDKRTGGNFNVYGYKRWRFLVPALVNRNTAACAVSA